MIKLFVLAAGLAAFGAAVVTRPQVPTVRRSAAWVEQVSPTQVGRFTYKHDPSDPAVSYKMDDRSYKELMPYGIVPRVFDNGLESYDTVVIASDWQWSFHDPRICFSAQGWQIKDDQEAVIHTSSHGDVPIRLLKISKDGQDHLAAFSFKGPVHMHNDTESLLSEWFVHDLRVGKSEGAMYRFIALYQSATPEKLEGFIGQFMDAACKSSGGLL
jgi:hypothetical protein